MSMPPWIDNISARILFLHCPLLFIVVWPEFNAHKNGVEIALKEGARVNSGWWASLGRIWPAIVAGAYGYANQKRLRGANAPLRQNSHLEAGKESRRKAKPPNKLEGESKRSEAPKLRLWGVLEGHSPSYKSFPPPLLREGDTGGGLPNNNLKEMV